jgi:hypothetical protein
MLAQPSSPSRVRFAAHTARALDCSERLDRPRNGRYPLHSRKSAKNPEKPIDRKPLEQYFMYMRQLPFAHLRHAICLVSGLLCISLPAASQVITANDSIPKTLTVNSAPESVVYRCFFGEFVASQKGADDLEAQGKDASFSRMRYQQLLALSASESQWFREVVAGVASTWDANKRRRADLARTVSGPDDRQRIQPEFATLAQQDNEALANAISLLRAQFGPEGFSRLDLRIRQYIVPHMRLMPISGR